VLTCSENTYLVAAQNDQVDVFMYLHSKSFPEEEEKCALEAASSGSSKVISWMLTRSCNFNAYGLTRYQWRKVLSAACRSDHFDIMIILKQFVHSGSTELLNLAVTAGRHDMVVWLLDHKVLPDGNTTSFAASNGHLDIARVLHTCGISFNAGAIDLAVKRGHVDMVRFLNEIGVDYTTIEASEWCKSHGIRKYQNVEYYSIAANSSTYSEYETISRYHTGLTGTRIAYDHPIPSGWKIDSINARI
jgi:hypothetical protein